MYEKNWACKHLAALVRTFPSCGPPGDGSRPGSPLTPTADVKKERASTEDWHRRVGVEAECQGTVIDGDWSDGDRSEGEEEHRGAGGTNGGKDPLVSDYKVPCDQHGLSHLLQLQADGSLPLASSPDPPSVSPVPLTFQQELDRDPEAQALATSTLGCILRRCLFREGKGGVHLSNFAQARLEGNVFRGLNYAVRCIQNSTVNTNVLRASGVFQSLTRTLIRCTRVQEVAQSVSS